MSGFAALPSRGRARRRQHLGFGLGVALLAYTPAHASDVKLELTGKPSVVYDSMRDACTPVDVPDINPRAYRDASGAIVMFALHYVNRALRGPDLTHLKIDCHVVLDSPLGADPAKYDDHNYIAATWTTDGRVVAALIHHEYHADQHKTCRVADALGCWFNTVLAYHSNDGGRDFLRATPFVVASAPFRQDVDQGRHRGFFNPSNMFSDGAYTYAFISTTGWSGQGAGNCLFRTANPSDPGTWRAWDGARFSVRYTDPYTTTPHPKPCATIEPFLFPVAAVVRHARSKLWIAIFQAAPSARIPIDGFYYATARDLTHWSEPRLLIAGKTAYDDLCQAAPSIINYPAILDPASPSRNFDTIGDAPLLFYDVIEVRGCETRQRLLVHQPLRLTLSGR